MDVLDDVLGWGWDQTTGWIGDAVQEELADKLRAMAMWVLNGLAMAVDLVLRQLNPNAGAGGHAVGSFTGEFLSRDWFQAAYTAMQQLAVGLALLALIIGIVTAAWTGNGWLIIKRISLQVLKWYALTFFTVELTMLALEIFTAMEQHFVTSALGGYTTDLFGPMVELHDAADESGALSALLVTLLSLILTLLSLVVVVVLFVRDAGLALVLLFAPLVAVLTMTSYHKAVSKYLHKIAGLVLFKFILVAGMTLGSAAMVGLTGVSLSVPVAAAVAEPPATATPAEAEAAAASVAAAEQTAVGGLVMDMLKGIAVMFLALFTPAYVTGILPVGGSDAHADKGQMVSRTILVRTAAAARR